jgi:hypothetical protein
LGRQDAGDQGEIAELKRERCQYGAERKWGSLSLREPGDIA